MLGALDHQLLDVKAATLRVAWNPRVDQVDHWIEPLLFQVVLGHQNFLTLVERASSLSLVDHIFFEVHGVAGARLWPLAGSQLGAPIVQLACIQLRSVFIVQAQLCLCCQDVGLDVVGQIIVDLVDDLRNLTVGPRAVDQSCLRCLALGGLLSLTLHEGCDCAK